MQPRLQLNLKHLPPPNSSLMYHTFSLPNKVSRIPYRQWQKMGRPASLSQEQIQTLLVSSRIQHSQPTLLKISKTGAKLNFILPSPIIFAVQLCSMNPLQLPPQPYWLSLTKSSNSCLVLSWRFSGDTSCLSSFIIQFSATSPISGYTSLSTGWVTDLSFQMLNPGHGWYRVSARDVHST